jgi:hypothetical protein
MSYIEIFVYIVLNKLEITLMFLKLNYHNIKLLIYVK